MRGFLNSEIVCQSIDAGCRVRTTDRSSASPSSRLDYFCADILKYFEKKKEMKSSSGPINEKLPSNSGQTEGK
jgi:hypothetical protein